MATFRYYSESDHWESQKYCRPLNEGPLLAHITYEDCWPCEHKEFEHKKFLPLKTFSTCKKLSYHSKAEPFSKDILNKREGLWCWFNHYKTGLVWIVYLEKNKLQFYSKQPVSSKIMSSFKRGSIIDHSSMQWEIKTLSHYIWYPMT